MIEPFEAGHGLEQRCRHRPRCDGQTSVRIAIDQVGEKTGRQHGIADARRGDKQDVHLADPADLISRAPRLAKPAILTYVYRAATNLPSMADARFVLLDDRGILAVSGPDRRAFLQGLVSNDVDKVTPAEARYAALLTAQGKYLHDFMMIEAAEAILLDGEAARLADLKRRLSIYRLRAKAALDERPDLAVAAVFGHDALAALGLSGEPGAARPFACGVAFVDPRLAALGGRCVLPRASVRSR